MNRPRHSVLALFDPLAAPTTPTRDEDEDKENSTPLSAFFARPHSLHPSTPVALPRKRLVDVGDTTIGDASIIDLLTEEREPDAASVPCLETPVPPFQPRTPLAELAPRDVDPTPVVRFRPLPNSPLNGHDSLTDNTFDNNSAIPAFNAHGINTPEILVSQPSQYTMDLDSPPDLPQVDSSFQRDIESASRLRAPNISSHRLSIDLQDAFQIHFQHNSSFDLLNDKISLTEPMESLMADDENFDFELERENMRDAMAKFQREFTPKRRISLRTTSDCDTQSQGSNDAMQSSSQISEEELSDYTGSRSGLDDTRQSPRSPTSPRDDHRPSLDFSTSPPEDKTSKRQSIPSKLPSPTARRGPIDAFPTPSEVQSTIPQGKQRRLSTPLVTPRRLPSIAPPPAIQALRIVKRTKTHHPKAESADNATLRAATTVALPTIQERFHTSSIPSKQGAGEGIATSTRTRESMYQSVLAKSSAAAGTSSTKPGLGWLGPRRVTVSENTGNTATKSNQPSQPTIPGPKRMPISDAGPTVQPSKSMATGLKQPTRPESSLPMTSNLPRPSGPTTRTSVSRLPAPSAGQSGISRLRRPAGGLPRRVVPGE